jgi:Skp family chaperone for outer membrane proteins
MKSTYKTAAQSLLLLAACLAAVAQSEINPDHFPDQAGPVAFAPRQEAQLRPLQTRLEDYEKLLQAKQEQVENARQEAISAGIVGDGAGPFIEFYRQQQTELEALQAALTPKIDQARATIAGLTGKDAEDYSLAQSRQP